MTEQHPGYPMAPKPPKKTGRKTLGLILGLVAFALLAFCCAGVVSNLGDDNGNAKRSTAGVPTIYGAPSLKGKPAPTYSTTTEAAEPKIETFSEGTYEVGKKSDPEAGTIKPGTFVLITGDHCYWERVSGFGGDFDEIIANDNLYAPSDKAAQARITVKRTDKGLTLSGDCILGQKGGLK